MRMRKAGSSSPVSPPRSPGVNRFGHTGLESESFHTGITKKAAISASAARARHNLHRAGHCGRCDARLVAEKCPSCGYDRRHDGDLKE